MMTALAGERRVAKRWFCLDERARRRLSNSKSAVRPWRLPASEEDRAWRRVAGASRQEQKR
jgi:hypothetical protein